MGDFRTMPGICDIRVEGSSRVVGPRVALRRYRMSRNKSLIVVPSARVSRRSVCVVVSRWEFSTSLMNDRATPLRWLSFTWLNPFASRAARRACAS